MAALTKDALLALKPKMEVVAVPELGEGLELYVREMNGLDVLDYGDMFNEMTDGGKKPFDTLPRSARCVVMQFLLQRTLCNADGDLMFEDEKAARRSAIPWVPMTRLFDAANRVNQIAESDAPKKSSEETPTSSLHAA